jgi:hypothetical protein
MKEATKLRAEKYMPKAQAIRLAKKAQSVTAVKPAAIMKGSLSQATLQSQEQQDKSLDFPALRETVSRPQAQELTAKPDLPVKGSGPKPVQQEKGIWVKGSASSDNEVACLKRDNEHLRQQVKQLTDQLSVLSEKLTALTAQLAGNKSVQPCDANEAKACDAFIAFLRSNPSVFQALEKTFTSSSK